MSGANTVIAIHIAAVALAHIKIVADVTAVLV